MKRVDKQPGGFARAAALTPERRSEIARLAVQKRWANAAEKKAGNAPALDVLETINGNISGSYVRLQT